MNIKDFVGMNTKTMIKFLFEQMAQNEPVDDYKLFMECINKDIQLKKIDDINGFWIDCMKKTWKYKISLFFCTLDGKTHCCRLRF